MFYVYIFSLCQYKYYIGFSANVNSRIYKHNTKHKGFIGQVDDWLIVYCEAFNDKTEAMAREKQIKVGKVGRLLKT